MIRFLLVLSFLFLASCGGGGGNDDSSDITTANSTAGKNLFSLWNRVGSDFVLDLREGDFDRPIPYGVVFNNGGVCECQLTALGDQQSGTYIINFCNFVVGSAIEDLGCNSLSQSGTYEKNATTLTIHPPTGPSEIYE